ncbi:SpoIIE family protein phosphatase [Streptomyces sp. NPDC088732]|uniref:SpoIIE family protein phosphatase n=1 Tax=Streptomyces sp. NPDC088732 TaxID=3365879 RepID=UPI00381201F1
MMAGHEAEPGDAAQAAAELDRALTEVVRATGSHAAAVFLLVREEQALRMEVVTGLSSGVVRPWTRLALAAPVPVATAVREGRPVWVRGHAELARRFARTAYALPYELAMIVMPLATGDEKWGALQMLWPGNRSERLTPREESAIGAAADRMSRALARAAASGAPLRPAPAPRVLPPEPPARRPPAEAQAAAELTERLGVGVFSLDLEGHITFLNNRAAELLGRDRKDLLHTRPWEALPWLDDPAFEDPYLGALFSRLPSRFTALRPPDHWLSFLLRPDATGVSVRVKPAGAPTADPGQPELPSAVAPTRAGTLYHLLYISAGLTEAVGLGDVTAAVTDQIVPVLGASGFGLLTADEGRFEVLATRGFSARNTAYFDRLSMSAATAGARVVETGVPAFYPHPEELRRAHPQVALYREMESWAFLPLNASGRTIGYCVLGYAQPRTFGPDDRAALTSLAGMIAQAVERARLYDAKNRLAHVLQNALLPRSLPDVPGLRVAARYLPATRGMDIGGDFYDLIRLDGSAADAVIGDVQGHSVGAAALMGQVRTAVHTHASTGAPPGEVLARINRLFEDLETDLFTSCLYARLDLPRQRVTLASAGHLPAIVRHPGGGADIVAAPAGILLGIEADAAYPTTEIPLPPGAVLLLYTDGLVERPGTDLGTAVHDLAHRLADSPADSLDVLADSLVREAQNTGQGRDDIALLLVGPENRSQ